MRKSVKLLAISGLFATLVLACTPKLENYPSLVNRGVLPLSTTNAYLGSNLFLAKEMENSTHLYNFLKQRGAPAAIEIEQNRFREPTLFLFYPQDREVYASEIQKREFGREWIVRGPYALQRKDFKQLNSIDLGPQGQAPFVIYGRVERFGRRVDPVDTVPVIKPILPVTPTPTPTPKPRKKAPVITGPVTTPTPDPVKDFHPLNTDQQALQMARGFAERASNGDVIHTVKGDTETMAGIAQWYTGNATQAEDLAKMNGIVNMNTLTPGQRIRIPMTSVKEFKAMPAK